MVAAAACMVTGCMPDTMCEGTVAYQVPSPDRRLSAIVFQYDCGATTSFSTHVSIVDSERELAAAPGNVFTADSNRGQAPADSTGLVWVRPVWAGPDSLEIRYDFRARPFLRQRRLGNVRIGFIAERPR